MTTTTSNGPVTGTPPPLVLAAELALASVTFAVVVGFTRIFAGWGFFGPLALAAAASHLLAIGARRLRLGLAASSLISLLALIVLGGIVFYASTTNHGIPTSHTWDAFSTELANSIRRFESVVAPVPAQGGEIVAAFVAIWLSALLSDCFAFRARAAIEALIPPTLVFVFCAALAADRDRLTSAALALAAAFAFALTFIADRRHGSATWLAPERSDHTRALLAGGSMLGFGAVLVGLVLGPAFPGAHQKGLIDVQGGGSATRVTPSPLVDIRGRLANRSEIEVFTVKAKDAAYWRLTALDIFNGKIWYSENGYKSANGRLPGRAPANAPVTQLNQVYTIGGLGSIWLPAAFAPAFISGPVKASYDSGSATLLTREPSVDGMQYTIASELPTVDKTLLENATGVLPLAIRDRYLALPNDFPDALRQQAIAVVGNAAMPYDKARVLQDWFRTNFSYSLDVRLDNGTNAIIEFLRIKKGYCEQFAGSFAALARSLGLPARVAVGFTPGELQADGIYHVRGRNSHAWPEVYFAGVGWVPFEPTPGRGVPGAASYTGVGPVADPAADSGTSDSTIPATSIASSPTTTKKSTKNLNAGDPPDLTRSGGGLKKKSAGAGWPARVATGALALAGLAALWPVSLAIVRRLRHRRRWRGATSRGERLLATWFDTIDALGVIGLRPVPSETRREFAHRASVRLPAVASPIATLALDTDAAVFGVGALDGPGDDEQWAETVAVIARTARQRTPWKRRFRYAFDPRPLVTRHESRRRSIALRPAG